MLAAASCDEVTPAAPAVTEAVCAGGVLVPPSIVLATTDDITYVASPDGPYAPGQRSWSRHAGAHRRRLAPDAADGLGQDIEHDGDVHGHVRRGRVHAGGPRGTDGHAAHLLWWRRTTPTIVLATTPVGVSYASSPAGPYDGTVDTPVTVTATLADGFEWGPLPDGWVEADPVTANVPRHSCRDHV